MKPFRILAPIGIVAAAMLLVPASASAADFSIFGSYYETDDYDEAIGVGARAAFFGDIQLEVGAAYYDEFGSGIDVDFGDIDFERVQLKLDVIPVDIGARFNIGEAFYVAGGGTYFILDSDRGSVDDEFGLYARVGFQFSHLFVEGGYRDVDGTIENLDLDELDEVEFNDGRADVDLTGFFVNVGWRF